MVFIPDVKEIKQRREELGLNQRQLAKLCNKRPSYLSMVESGEVTPSLTVFKEIFKVLDEQSDKATENLMTASKICSKNPLYVSPTANIEETSKQMKIRNFSQLPVISSHRCQGLVTENSILKYQLAHGADNLNRVKVTKAMEPAPPIIDWNQPLTPRILDLLYDAQCLLVNRDGKIQGIIAKIDAIRGKKK